MQIDKLFEEQLIDDYGHFLNIKKYVETVKTLKNPRQRGDCKVLITLTFKAIRARAIQYGYIKTGMGIKLTNEEYKMIEEIVNYEIPHKGVTIAMYDDNDKFHSFSIS